MRAWLADLPVPHTELRGVQPEWIAVDPSAASFRVQLYRDGLPSALADNDVLGGIRLVSSLFAAGLLAIHSSCTDLIDELTGYAWDPDASDKGLDEPLKVDDHGPDQLRYAVMTTEAIWRPHVRLEIAA